MADEKSDTVAALPALPIRVRTGPTTSFGMARTSPGAAGVGKLNRWADITPGATPTPYPTYSSGGLGMLTPAASDLPAEPSMLWGSTPTPSARATYMEGFGFNLPSQSAATSPGATTAVQAPQMQAPQMQVVQQMPALGSMGVPGTAAPQLMFGIMPANGTAQPTMAMAPMVVSSNGTGMAGMSGLAPVAPQTMMIASSQVGASSSNPEQPPQQMLPQQIALPQQIGVPQGMVLMMAPAPVGAMAAAPVGAIAAAPSSAMCVAPAPASVTSADVSSAPAAIAQQQAPQAAEPSNSSCAEIGRQVFQEALNDNSYDDPASAEVLELVRSGKLPSPGSALHPERCNPCAWFWKAKGCQNDKKCSYCHLCPEGELKARKKAKIALMRTGALEKDEGGGGDPPTLRLEALIDPDK